MRATSTSTTMISTTYIVGPVQPSIDDGAKQGNSTSVIIGYLQEHDIDTGKPHTSYEKGY
jgi:hypothetical protein